MRRHSDGSSDSDKDTIKISSPDIFEDDIGNGLGGSGEDRQVVDIKSKAKSEGSIDRIVTPLDHIPFDPVKPVLSAGALLEIKCCRDELLESFADVVAAKYSFPPPQPPNE